MELMKSVLVFAISLGVAYSTSCNAYQKITCGEHEAEFNAICESYEKTSIEPNAKECGNLRCFSQEVTLSFDLAGFGTLNLEMEQGNCGDYQGAARCVTEEEIAAADPSYVETMQTLKNTGLEISNVNACFCDGDLCNGASAKTAGLTIILSAIFALLFNRF